MSIAVKAGRRNGRMTASEKVERMVEGKPRNQQIAILNHYLAKNKDRHGIELDVYIAAVNKKVALECNGISKEAEKNKPESEGIMKGGELAAGRALAGLGGC
jgi:hypothetical protein